MFKALFLHIPRTGGTFLSNYFSAAGNIYIHGHNSLSEIDNISNMFTFSFIRNPWDWYVSQYFFEKKFKKLPSFEKYLKETNKYWLIDVFNKLCFKNGEYSIDYMGRFENIPKSIKEIFLFSEINPNVAYEDFCKTDNKNRVNSTVHKYYTEYYTDELINIVSEKNKIIIDKFNYSFRGKK